MKCDFCELRCDLERGSLCGSYCEENGQIKEIAPFTWTTHRSALCEDLPIFHGWPRRKVLELGGARCNAACSYCINARVVDTGARKPDSTYISAERLLEIARITGCSGVHFGISEVTVALLSAFEVAKLFRQNGYIAGASTNGYMTPETAVLAAENFDYLNISLKSTSDDYYRAVTRLPGAGPVLRNIAYFAGCMHVEVTTPIAQGLNDDEIIPIAVKLAEIDPNMVWHILRLQPEHKMGEVKPPDINELSEKVSEARKILPYTYFSNFIGSNLDNTICPHCGETLIRRLCIKTCGATLTDYRLPKDKTCPVCGSPISICGEPDESIRS